MKQTDFLTRGIFGVKTADNWKARDTAKQAAADMALSARTLRLQVLNELKKASGTADEIAKRLGLDILSVRPRMSELSKLGLVRETPTRRKNVSGKSAVVWEIFDSRTE